MDKFLVKRSILDCGSAEESICTPVVSTDTDLKNKNIKQIALKSTCTSNSKQDSENISNSQTTVKARHEKQSEEVTSTSNLQGDKTDAIKVPKSFDLWKAKYNWLFLKSSGKSYCSVCCEAVEKKLSLPTESRSVNSRKAFVEDGFAKWKNATSRYAAHERSAFHLAAISGLLSNKKPSICTVISTAKTAQIQKARFVLNKIFSTAIFLARQGLALHGDNSDENSNFIQLMKTRSEDFPELKEWLQQQGSGKNQWVHHDIVDEILKTISQEIVKKILEKVKKVNFFAVIGDETSDAARKEQFSFSIRTVTDELIIEEDFLGFYETANTKLETLYKIIKDILIRFQLDISHLRGQCYDGAANMSGEISGLQKRLREDEPTALYIHCRPHTVSLVVQDAMEGVMPIKNFLGILKEAINFIRDFPKRLAKFKDLLIDDVPDLMSFCPTRWLLRVGSVKRMYNHTVYDACLDFLEEKRNGRESDPSACAKADGLYKAMNSFEFYFFMTIVISTLERVETLNAELQKCNISISEAHSKIRIVTGHLEILRTSGFENIWMKAVEGSYALDLPNPELSCQRRKSSKIDSAPNNAHTFSGPKEYYKQIFYELNDQVIMSMRERFECETLKLLELFEGYMIGTNTNLTAITSFYTKDFNSNRLSLHRQMFLDQAKLKNVKIQSVQDIVNYLKHNRNLADLIPEFVKLVKLMLTLPASSCTAERSFSTLRRLKNYLRSSIKAERLNNLSFLHVHKELVDELMQDHETQVKIINHFIVQNSLRKSTFALL